MKYLKSRKMSWTVVGLLVVVGLHTEQGKADVIFGPPTNMGPNINSDGTDGLTISKDGLSIFFFSDRPNSPTWDLFTSVRKTTNDAWEPAMNPGTPLNGPRSEGYPSLSADGLELYYTAPYWQAGWTEFGRADLWVSRRSSVSEPWGPPQNLGATINTAFHDTEPSISQDGLELYFSSNRPGGYGEWNIWVTTRNTIDDPWQEPTNLGQTVNSGMAGTPNISCDGLVLFFSSSRPGGYGETDIWLTRRKSKNEPWGEPVNLGPPVNDLNAQWAPCLSHDGSTLYFTDQMKRPRYGYFDVWQVDVSPIVDFNGDGIVDAADMCIMIDHWGEDYSLCDIGPMPFGDGIVDVEDLIVLAEYLFEETLPPGCIAYWKLDQTEGNIAHNSAGFNDGICHGEPLWRPADGRIGGALQFDGIDDYIETDFVLNPAGGAFSVFAWIKGGAPGQVILSQIDGTNWLGADPLKGKLTGLGSSGDQSSLEPLLSEFMITDGTWHNIGIVVGAYQSMRFRSLYVDGETVAIDTQSVELRSSNGGLYIGAGKNLETGSFFSGLIDDVRIYNRVVSP
jgi:hypothetical protein